MSLQLNDRYVNVLADLKEKIRQARLQAILKVNYELLKIYWEVGKAILDQQKEEGWGAKIIDRLAVDLKVEFPDFKGLSIRNLKYMRTFAEAYPDFLIVQLPTAQLREVQSISFVQPPAAQITWTHHCVILEKVKKKEDRQFYINKTIENNWSKSLLSTQIDSQLHLRQGNAINNFEVTIPKPQTDLARETFKNPYVFDFLSLSEGVQELELERALMEHIKKFMLELGRGFAYVGNQKNLNVAGDDYFLDLLFYNYSLHRFVIFELKIGEFKPEYAGKLNFYINTVNEQVKGNDDLPTIGVLLCKTPNETVVKFALKGIDSPIGVAEYELAQVLPKQLKGEMPTIEELEAELDKEYEELKRPTQKRFDILKQRLTSLKLQPVQIPVSHKLICEIHDESLNPLFNELLNRLRDFNSDFVSYNYFWTGPTNLESFEDWNKYWKDEEYMKSTNQYYFLYRLNGLKVAGVDTFDEMVALHYLINPYWYGFSTPNFNNNQPFLRKLYTERLTQQEIQFVCDKICDVIIQDIEMRLEHIEERNRKIID